MVGGEDRGWEQEGVKGEGGGARMGDVAFLKLDGIKAVSLFGSARGLIGCEEAQMTLTEWGWVWKSFERGVLR